MSSHNFSDIPNMPEFEKELNALKKWVKTHPGRDITSRAVAQAENLNARQLSLLLILLSSLGILNRTIWIKDPSTHEIFGPYKSPDKIPKEINVEHGTRRSKLEDLEIEARYSFSVKE